jgi:hypothetical protein
MSPARGKTGQRPTNGPQPSSFVPLGTTDARPFPALLCHMCASLPLVALSKA